MLEKRKFSRLDTNEETLLSTPDGRKTEAKSVNVSVGGMKILTNENFAIGTMLSGKFSILPHIGPFYVKGEVTWSRPCQKKFSPNLIETGIKFTEINSIPI